MIEAMQKYLDPTLGSKVDNWIVSLDSFCDLLDRLRNSAPGLDGIPNAFWRRSSFAVKEI